VLEIDANGDLMAGSRLDPCGGDAGDTGARHG
jgi:hypothetical protein